jgi:metal-responsive CopG/Arc/MetJ family transcriptional regulator
MSRTTKNVGFTVPASIAEEFEQMAKEKKEEQRTKSELFREMLCVYCSYRKKAPGT